MLEQMEQVIDIRKLPPVLHLALILASYFPQITYLDRTIMYLPLAMPRMSYISDFLPSCLSIPTSTSQTREHAVLMLYVHSRCFWVWFACAYITLIKASIDLLATFQNNFFTTVLCILDALGHCWLCLSFGKPCVSKILLIFPGLWLVCLFFSPLQLQGTPDWNMNATFTSLSQYFRRFSPINREINIYFPAP